MKLTVVLDNQISPTTKRPYIAQHGLSMLVEANGKLFLYDTGQSDSVIHNLSLLGIRPADLSAVIISHGHYDHTGGLKHILVHSNRSMPVYIAPGTFKPRFSSETPLRFVGVPECQQTLESVGGDFHIIVEPFQLTKDLWVGGPITAANSVEASDDPLYELALFQATPEGLLVITGCAHSGVVETVEYGMSLLPCKKLKGLIGGTHLNSASQEQLDTTIEYLKKLNPDFIATNHCTGFLPMVHFQHTFGEKFQLAATGFTMEL